MASITIAELQLFHSIDREIFARLVLNLKRTPSQSLLFMALWLWLEDHKHSKLIKKMTTISNELLDALANEATLCLNFLKSKSPTNHGGSLPLTSRLMEVEVSLNTLSAVRYTAIGGMKSFLTNVCAWIFTDILLQVLPNNSSNNNSTPLSIPGFPHPIFGSLDIFVIPPNFTVPSTGNNNNNNNNNNNRGWDLHFEAPIEDRTMFLTFSRGFPVSEDEAKDFFIRRCGNCIESFEMETVREPKVQPLFARMELNSVAQMDQIMGGMYVGKFRSNGKHIWARKFEQRDMHKMKKN